MEGCTLGDLIAIAIKLSDAGLEIIGMMWIGLFEIAWLSLNSLIVNA